MPMRKTIRRSSGTPALRSAIALLNFDSAINGVDHASTVNDCTVAGSFDHATVMDGDSGIGEIAAKGSQTRQTAVLIRSRQPGVPDHVRGQNGHQPSLRAFR